MTKLYVCDECGKSYKNSRSLRTHRYSYHHKRKSELEENQPKPLPNRKPLNSQADSANDPSNYSSDDSFDEFLTDDLEDKLMDVEMDTMQLKTDIEFLKSAVDELKSLTRVLEKDLSDKSHPKKYDVENEANTSLELKSAIQSNKKDIAELLKDRLTYNETDESDHDDDLEEKDLIEDLIELKGLFSSHDYEKITVDIPKLRKIFNFMLRNLNVNQVGNEGINLLNSISKSSKSVAAEMVRDNFTQLTNIFEEMKDDIEKLSDSRHENVSDYYDKSSEHDLSSNSEDYSEVTDTEESDHDSVYSSKIEDHANSEADTQYSKESEY